MDEETLHLIEQLREAVAADRVEVTSHFEQRICEQGLLWIDVLTILENPSGIEEQGPDVHGWPKWRIWGQAADGTSAGVVVAVRPDKRVRFITIHWEE